MNQTDSYHDRVGEGGGRADLLIVLGSYAEIDLVDLVRFHYRASIR